MHQVQYRGDGDFEIPTLGGFRDRNDMVFGPAELLAPVSAVSVRDALQRFIADYGKDSARLWLSPDGCADFDDDMSSVLDTMLEYDGDRLTVLVVVAVSPWDDDAVGRLSQLLEPLSIRLRVPIASCRHDDSGVFNDATLVEIRPDIRRRTVGQLLATAEQFSALAAAFDGQGITPSSAADLLRGGHARALLGSPESGWLEVKRTPPTLDALASKLTFAKHVAAFANSPDGGLIGYGLATRKTTSGDVVDRVTPFPAHLIKPTTMTAVIRGRVYPPPLGVAVEAIVGADGMATALVHVPPQPDERKPFVVRGSFLDGKVREQYVGLPVRVGEDTVWDDLAGIHSLLVAGRAALSSPIRSSEDGDP